MSGPENTHDMDTKSPPEAALDAQQAVHGDESLFMASQWRLMWWKFLDHRLAVVSGVILLGFYFLAIFCEFLSPSNPHVRCTARSLSPPQRVHFFKGWRPAWPYVYPLIQEVNPETLRLEYEPDTSRPMPIRFFAKGDPYKMWGLIPMKRHFIGLGPPEGHDPAEGIHADQRLYLLGSDRLGRDLLSRIFHGSRISLSIGLVGVFLSLTLGIIIGGISGYYGGYVDVVIQRIIEIFRGFPRIPLWLAMSAAMPATWSIVAVYFCMTVIIACIGWTSLARVVRGKILALREEDFAMAARVAGVKEFSILMRHLVPSFMSHLIVSVTLAVPGMILAETSLSFLRLGLRPPAISWGVLLQDAQYVAAIRYTPWLLWPIAFVIVAVLMFNFLGDGLRDAADPYSH